MTNAEVLALTIERCDKHMQEEMERVEIMFLDLGASPEELETMLELQRRWLQQDRDSQIAMVRRWLMYGDEKIH